MFERLTAAPPDAILGLSEAFRVDPNPAKINLGVGVFKDAQGRTPILESVKEAEARILDTETTKGYLAISGSPDFNTLCQKLVFGADHAAVQEGRIATLQTPGGTGALRVVADFVGQNLPGSKVWFSTPTWANHAAIFAAARVPLQHYPYFHKETNSLDLDGMLSSLSTAAAGDIVVLHGCCHNPTGVDPAPDDWKKIAGIVAERQLLPLVDFAYQGLGEGIREDATPWLVLAEDGRDLMVCNSFSKNFSLYNERVGGLHVVAASSDAAAVALSQLKRTIRTNYSNPPAHGAAIVSTILSDEELRTQWEGEVTAIRQRIAHMRQLFAETMQSKAPGHDMSFINRQRGMFSFSGLNPMQVDRLRSEHSIYIVGSGRINVAGMTEDNMDRLCAAIASVL